jgi:hypothetical protein
MYQHACEWSIEDEGSLLILDLCDAPATNHIEGLPTWVPDLSKDRESVADPPSMSAGGKLAHFIPSSEANSQPRSVGRLS